MTMARYDYNAVVIGAGSAGLMVAAGAAGLGARVALVERHKMGGDCLNYGCVPSKALLYSAKTAAVRRAGGAEPPPWAEVAANVRRAVDTIAPHDSVERFTELGVDVMLGGGRLTGPHEVEVDLNEGGTRRLAARSVVVATGSGPLVPDIPGLAEAGYVTNETVFTMPDRPRRLLVVGGGPIGVELGQAFAKLGSAVTLVEMGERILPRDDADAAALVREALERDGVRVVTGATVTRAEGGEGGKRAQLRHAGDGAAEEEVEVDEILMAAGRRLNVDALGLEAAGVRMDNGRPALNDRLQTSLPSVYACGDLAGPYLFTHMANQQARVVIQNALFPKKARMDYRVVPWATFTDPELAQVGLTEAAAEAQGIPYRVLRIPYAGVDRMVCDDATDGFLKVLTPPGRDDILGATMVGAHAGELIHELVLAMSKRLRLRDLAGTVHIYPTMAEIMRRAGDESRKAGFTPTLQRWVARYLRWHRR